MPTTPGPGRPFPRESYAKILANLGGVATVLVAIAVLQWRASQPKPALPAIPISAEAKHPDLGALPTKLREVETNAQRAKPQPDRRAIAQAESALAAAKRNRAQAEARAHDAADALTRATQSSAASALAARTLARRVRDPSARIARASQRASAIQAQRSRLQAEVAGIAQAPRPKRKDLVDRTPVARPAEGNEFHFEIRRNRVAFIDLERLLDRVKADAQMRIRMSDDGRPISSTVGPIGAFSLSYELARALPAGVEDMLHVRGPSYSLRSWEVVPEFDGRGETLEMAFQPAADFARTINRLNPAHATITLWIYPDGFGLYRKLRDELHSRGFLVAARPLPEGMRIRGSPAGSLSAGQ